MSEKIEFGGALPAGQWVSDVEKYIFHDEPSIWLLATWAWALGRSRIDAELLPAPPTALLDCLLSRFLSDFREGAGMSSFALTQAPLPRGAWKPILTEKQSQRVREGRGDEPDSEHYMRIAGLMIAFYAGTVWSEEELAARLAAREDRDRHIPRLEKVLDDMLEQMGETGRKYLKSERSSR